MAEQSNNDSCEEPDADFFDTFFDDGVLETIGEVLGDQKSNSSNHESSCEPFDAHTENSSSSSVVQTKENNVLVSQNQRHLDDKSLKSSEDEIILLETVQLDDKDRSSNVQRRKSQFSLESRSNVSEELVQSQANGENLPSKPSEKSTGSAIHAVDLEKDGENDVITSNKVKENGAVESAVPAVGEKRGKDLSINKEIQSSSSPTIPHASLSKTPPQSSCPDTALKATRDDTEKENDLVLEDTCVTKDSFPSPPGKKSKININLKTQILSLTTILNSRSSCKPELCTSSPDRNKCETAPSTSAVPSKELYSSVSSLTDKSIPDKSKPKGNKKAKKRRRDRSSPRESATSDHERSKCKEYGKTKRRKRNDESPQHRRSRRSRSRSISPSYTSKNQARRTKSPHNVRRNHPFSRSPSPSSRRHMRRPSRSPSRYRSRSRSFSPSSRRRRRSRSKSPFINEICRLKKQWDREDREKETSSKYSQPSSEMLPTAMPFRAGWRDESGSSAFVSNTMSVSVESVQFCSTSFALGSPMNGYHPTYPVGPPMLGGPAGPQIQRLLVPPPMRPDYSFSNNRSTYVAPSSTGFRAQPDIPELLDLPYTQSVLQPCLLGVEPTLQVGPRPSSAEPSRKTMETRSGLRKQLDILMATVVVNPVAAEVRSPGSNLESRPLEQATCDLEKSRDPDKCLTFLNANVNLIPSSSELSVMQDSVEEGVIVEEYDSDVIIEEPPPKPAVELICISGDELDHSILHDLNVENESCEKPSSAEPSCVKLSTATAELSRGTCAGLPDAEQSKVESLKPGLSSEVQSHNTEAAKGPKRKRKKKRKRNPMASLKDMEEDKATEKLLDRDETSTCSSENVIRDCSEMIDSLRIGRFVLTDKDKAAEAIPPVKSVSNSPLVQSLPVEFSFTKDLKLSKEPTSKDMSTNTPIRLCIDVCTGTENTAVLKECMTQTALGCLECEDKKDLIREMNVQLLTLQKERDELLAIVADVRGAQIKAQSIPGLDFPPSDGQESPGNKHTAGQRSLTCMNSLEGNLNNVQMQSNSWTNSTSKTVASISENRMTAQIGNSYSTETSFSQALPGEPILAFDYNHSSPVRTGSQPQHDSYLIPKRPFQ